MAAHHGFYDQAHRTVSGAPSPVAHPGSGWPRSSCHPRTTSCPRATIGLIEGARALAYMRGRSYALPEDMTGLVPDVLRHRLVLSYEALADGLNADGIIRHDLGR